jgi:hypothetical protein
MGLNISATSGEFQFKPKTLEIYVKSWVPKIKSSNTLSTQTNKLKNKGSNVFQSLPIQFQAYNERKL